LGAIGGELSGKNWKGLVKNADVDLPSPDEAAVTFAELASQAFLQASPNWIAGYTGDLLRGKKIDAYLIYMPTFIPWFKETKISSGLKIGGIPVKLVAGASSVRKVGGLLGIGVSVDKRNTQLLRMDYHAFRPGHGGSSGLQKDELAILKENRYHMHVYRWGHASSGD
jgi:hypothetical protein